ncbi:hypothetical protein QWY85_19090 [Neolewinella lacunae]|uniref:Uncharacterized protein n=1 Tax=Neolewinella lacunae TaxID=1517758 RepID=A0A923PP72_9BACT|nr:hypothetical protein [Neolewinella lacunae]MBC6994863.1 hypothetical protein [Neolewinella lacunae]MDN3636783.1 hypothetical protein [Neolewinella lacunae]
MRATFFCICVALSFSSGLLASNESCPYIHFGIPQIINLHSGERIVFSPENPNDLLGITAVMFESGKGKSGEAKLQNGYFAIDLASVDPTTTIFYTDRCGNERLIRLGKDIVKADYWYSASRSFHDFLKDAYNNKGYIETEALLDLVLTSDYNPVEKASFVQHHFLSGKPVFEFEDLLSREQVLKHLKGQNGEKVAKCDCSGLSVPAEYQLSPGDIRNAEGPNGFYELGQNTGQPNPRHVANLNGRELEFFQGGVGPAKTWFAYSDGWKRDGGDFWGGEVGNSNASATPAVTDALLPNFGARIGQIFTLICSGGATRVDPNCQCEKEVEIRWFYESTIDVRAQKLQSGNGNRAVAIGEDVAVAYSVQENGPNINPTLFIPGVLRNFNSAACESNPNDSWIGDALQLTFLVAATVASIVFGGDLVGTTPSVPEQTALLAVQSGLVNQTIAQVGELLDGQPAQMVPAATCGVNAQGTPSQLVATPKEYVLEPGKSLYVGIMSSARMVSRGTRSWQSEVIIKSDFYLTAFLPAGALSGNNEPDCCDPNVQAFYWSHSFDPSLVQHNYIPAPEFSFIPPSDKTELRSKVAREIFAASPRNEFRLTPDERGDFSVPFDYAHLIGRSKFSANFCNIGFTGSDGEDPFPDIENPFHDNGTSVNKSVRSSTVKLIIYDVMGRIVQQEKTTLDRFAVPESGAWRFSPELLRKYLQSKQRSISGGQVYFVSLYNEANGEVIFQEKMVVQ